MAFLELVFLVAVAHSLTVPVTCADYNSDNAGNNATAALAACIATRWCVWQQDANPGTNCYADQCLEWYADGDTTAQATCTGKPGGNCVLYYVTDTVTCSNAEDGTPKSQADLFCRTGSTSIIKKPVDACFHQDLKARSQTPPTTACANTAGLSCAWDSDTARNYCYDTGAPQPIASYGVDDAAYCQSLGTAYCNLYPKCTLNSAGDKCVVDPCSTLTAQSPLGSACLGAGGTHCVSVTAQSVTDTGTISLITNNFQCVSKESWGGVKKNEYNSCFFGYTGAKVPNATAFNDPRCYSVSERDKCGGAAGDAVVYDNQGTTATTDTYCQLVDIAEGWLPTEKLCWDGIVSYPKPDAGFAVHVPSLVLLVVALIAALL